MLKRKPSPEMTAINAVMTEIQTVEAERRAAMERLRAVLKEKPEPVRHARHGGDE